MISRFECQPCDPIFMVEQWHWQKKIPTNLNATVTKKNSDDSYFDPSFEQPNASLNIFHSLFKIIEAKNV